MSPWANHRAAAGESGPALHALERRHRVRPAASYTPRDRVRAHGLRARATSGTVRRPVVRFEQVVRDAAVRAPGRTRANAGVRPFGMGREHASLRAEAF